jgi:hypothetical protein
MLDIFCLSRGCLHHRPGAIVFKSRADLSEAYWLNRDRLVAIRGVDPDDDHRANEPGTRLRCFWKFEATERPQQIGWRKIRAKLWMQLRGVNEGDIVGRRKVFELEEDVLRRLGQITPEEDAALDRIKRADAAHVAQQAGARCRCRICARHRTYAHRLDPFLQSRDGEH